MENLVPLVIVTTFPLKFSLGEAVQFRLTRSDEA